MREQHTWTVVSNLASGQPFRLQRFKFTKFKLKHLFLTLKFSSLTCDLLPLEQRLSPLYFSCEDKSNDAHVYLVKVTVKVVWQKAKGQVKSKLVIMHFMQSEWWYKHIDAIFIRIPLLVQVISKYVFSHSMIMRGKKVTSTSGHGNEKSEL